MRRAGTVPDAAWRRAVLAVAALAAAVAPAAFAQVGAAAAEPAPAASRWSAQAGQIDDALRAQWLVATTPRANWLAGALDAGDPAAQVARLAAARVAAPDDRLSSPRSPPRASRRCGRGRRSATRSTGWPTGRPATSTTGCRRCCSPTARGSATTPRRRSRTSTRRGAAALRRLRSRGARDLGGRARAAGPTIPAARALAASSYGLRWDAFAAGTIDGLCRDGQAPTDAILAACAAAGSALAQRRRRGRCASRGRGWPSAARPRAGAGGRAAAARRRAAPRVRLRGRRQRDRRRPRIRRRWRTSARRRAVGGAGRAGRARGRGRGVPVTRPRGTEAGSPARHRAWLDGAGNRARLGLVEPFATSPARWTGR